MLLDIIITGREFIGENHKLKENSTILIPLKLSKTSLL